MTAIEPTGQVLGAMVSGIDPSGPHRHAPQRVADYRPDEHRLMKRCQVMADRIFEPAFVREALSAVSSPAGTPAR